MIDDIAISLIDKRLKVLNRLLGKELKFIKKNLTHNYMVANDLKSKIYELVFLRTQIQSYHSETKKASQNNSSVEEKK